MLPCPSSFQFLAISWVHGLLGEEATTKSAATVAGLFISLSQLLEDDALFVQDFELLALRIGSSQGLPLVLFKVDVLLLYFVPELWVIRVTLFPLLGKLFYA